MKNKARWVKNLEGSSTYFSFKTFYLSELKIEFNSPEDIKLLIETSNKIQELNQLIDNIPSKELFTYMYVYKESLISSQIEHTQATLEDLFSINNEQLNNEADVAEVTNYIKAFDFALNQLKELPICNRFIKLIHKQLLNQQRGKEKSPGEFRRSQNWIGSSNSGINNAKYVPPNVSDMNDLLFELEQYINSDSNQLNKLIKCSLIHYQFETIHPFLDGNGRIGRLLIVLYLIQNNIINSSIFYPSYFLKKNQQEYYDRLTLVREKGDYHQWIAFFLNMLKESAIDAIDTTKKLIELDSKLHSDIPKLNKNKNYQIFYQHIQNNPIFNIKLLSEKYNISFNTVKSIIEVFQQKGYVLLRNNKQRYKEYAFEPYLDILRKDTELNN